MPRPATSRATWRNRWRRASPDIPPTGLAKGRVRCDRDAYTGGMSDTQLLLLLLVAVCAAIVLLVVLLLRKPGLALEAALREEQRDGRGELRQQLDSLSSAQAQRIEGFRSEEHTSELQSLMRISYAVFCLTKKKKQHHQ